MNNVDFTNIWDYIYPDKYTFNFFTGGRGIGKTYSVLKNIYEEEIPFIYLRYTNSELDIAVNADLFAIYGDKIKYKKLEEGFYSFLIEGKVIGYGLSLTTFKSKMGIDFSSIKIIFFDEFIPEIGSRKLIKYPGAVFQNAYETVNRNRELYDQEPVLVICCANSNDIANPLMIDLGLTNIAEQLIRENRELHFNSKRRLCVGILKASPSFLEEKSKTALYAFATQDFKDMSLNNIFTYNDFTNVKRQNLKGYIPIVSIKNQFTIYKLKNDNQYYLHPSRAKCDIYDITNDIEKQKLLNKYLLHLNAKYFKNNIRFATYEIKKTFIDLFIKY